MEEEKEAWAEEPKMATIDYGMADPLPELEEGTDTPVLVYQLVLVMLVAALLLLCYFLLPEVFWTLKAQWGDLFGVETDFVAWGKSAGEALQTMLTLP